MVVFSFCYSFILSTLWIASILIFFPIAGFIGFRKNFGPRLEYLRKRLTICGEHKERYSVQIKPVRSDTVEKKDAYL